MTIRQAIGHITVTTRGRGLHEMSQAVSGWLAAEGVRLGLLTLFCRHTSCSLLIQENADPDVRTDLEAYFARLAPEGAGYIHDSEGPDDMPAHIRSALTAVNLSIPVEAGRLTLGMWQGIYLFEHRARPHRREIVLHFLGE